MSILDIVYVCSPGGSIMGTKGVSKGMQGEGSTTEPGGIMEVAMLGFHLAWA
jgi:hypothetical protein